MQKHRLTAVLSLALISLLAPIAAHSEVSWVGADFGGNKCWNEKGSRGRDYTDSSPGVKGREFLPVVERKHFGPEIQNLVLSDRTADGKRAGIKRITAELDYVLGQYPNHYKALYLMSEFPAKIVRRLGSTQQQLWLARDDNPVYSAVIVLSDRFKLPRFECYFQRATAWRPKDPVLQMLFGIYAQKTGRLEHAETLYGEALRLNPRYADAHYNLGLLLFELGRYEESREAAKAAYGLGFQLPGLRRKLVEADYPLD
jgi:tetratricopeptide (TPR) repeat protein